VGVNRSGAVDSLNLDGFFDYLGYSDGALGWFIPLIILGLFIFILIKLGPWFLIISGIVLIIISNTDFIYSTGSGILIGIVLGD